MLIDFTEINDDHAFEQFAQLFLKTLGFNVTRVAAVGQDGGVDLICEQKPVYGNIGYRWLVSCKHYAGSRRSIGKANDQADERTLREHRCNGFMFLYSTPVTEILRQSVERVASNAGAGFHFFTPWEIENEIIKSPIFYPLINQFFPVSHNKFIDRIMNEGSCCQSDTPDIPGYIFYSKNQQSQKVEATNVCGYCIQDYIERYEDNNYEYSFYQTRSGF